MYDKLDKIGIDFETFYTREYTLSKLTTQEYVLSPHFEIIGVGVQVNDEEPQWFSGTLADTKKFLSKFNWGNAVAIAHNAVFDGAILEWVLDIHPKYWFCTMMAARPLCAPWTPQGRVNLKYVATYLGLGVKGTEAQVNIGFMRKDFDADRLAKYGEYCMQDTRLTVGIFNKLAPQLPTSEKLLIHETIRKFTRPQILLDRRVLEQRLGEVRASKERALLDAGITDTTMLMSNPQFAAALEMLGVDPPTKVSPTTNRETWAFAKTDAAFKELLDHDDVRVQALVAARLKHKSTLEESRIQKFIALSHLKHPIGVPLLYYGAHTGRFSGMDGLNMQNLPRGGALREAMIASPGYKIIAGDLSQIEARITACLAEQNDLVQVFANGGDPYCYFASQLYKRTITKADTQERFMGKTAILGLGYGMGAAKFKLAVKTQAEISVTEAGALEVVDTYRKQFDRIASLWRILDNAIRVMASGADTLMTLGPVVFGHEHVRLPNGMSIHYPNLRVGLTGGYEYTYRGRTKSLWGGALLENIVQALAKIVLTTAELRLAKRGIHAFMQVHDELVYCVPDQYVDAIAKALDKVLTAPVPWLPALPVACEIKIGNNYKECK